MTDPTDSLIARADMTLSGIQRSRALLLDSLSDGDASAKESAYLGTSSALPLRDAFTIADCERMAGIVPEMPPCPHGETNWRECADCVADERGVQRWERSLDR